MLLCDMCKKEIKQFDQYSLSINDNEEGDGFFGESVFALDLCHQCSTSLENYISEFVKANQREGFSRKIKDPKYDLICKQKKARKIVKKDNNK